MMMLIECILQHVSMFRCFMIVHVRTQLDETAVSFLLLPHISNFIKERQLRLNLSTTKDRKEELLQLKKELSSISMTDEFARHAKLQRKINAIQDELAVETTNATNKATA